MKTAVALAAVSSVSAFQAPNAAQRAVSSINMESQSDLSSLAQGLNPTIGFWDPMGLAQQEFWGESNEATIGFLRHAEIKHGRVAMMGFVGYCVQANGIHWPWPMTLYDKATWPTMTSPPEQWDALSMDAKWQFFLFIGFLEMWGESSNLLKAEGGNHYMRGGKPGQFPSFDAVPHPVPFNLYDPFGLNKNKSPEAKAKSLKAEINNGRLAMIGLFGFLAESKCPGSVPVLQNMGAVQPYSGNYMAPLESTFHFWSSGDFLFIQP